MHDRDRTNRSPAEGESESLSYGVLALPGSIFPTVKADVGLESVQYRAGGRYTVSW